LFTKDLGKVAVVARGARTPKSPFGSSLEPLGHIRATINHGRMRDMHTISAAEPVALRRRITSSLAMLEAGLLMCNLVMRTHVQEGPDERVFELLRDALAEMDTSEEDVAYSIALGMRLRCADIMGFGLPGSHAPDGPVVRVDLTDGVARPDGAAGFHLSRAVYEIILRVLRGERLAVAPQDHLECESFLSLYFSHHLDRRVPAKAPYISK